jgi:hypothetical protein
VLQYASDTLPVHINSLWSLLELHCGLNWLKCQWKNVAYITLSATTTSQELKNCCIKRRKRCNPKITHKYTIILKANLMTIAFLWDESLCSVTERDISRQ